MVKKENYSKFVKDKIKPRFETLLKLLNQQNPDSSTYYEIKKQFNKIIKEFQPNIPKEEGLEKFYEILSLMKQIQKQLYSFEKANTLIIEYCDEINTQIGKRKLYFEIDDEQLLMKSKHKLKKERKQLKNDKIPPKTIQIIVKVKKQRQIFKIIAMIFMLAITISFFIPSGETREFTEHIFPRTVNMTIEQIENISLIDYFNQTTYKDSTLNLKGRIEYLQELTKYNVTTFNIYLKDDDGNKIILNWIKRNDLELLNKNGTTKEYFLVTGDYDYINYNTGIEGPTIYVDSLEKTTLERWNKTISKRLPAEDIIKEKELSIGMKNIYRLIDKYNEKINLTK